MGISIYSADWRSDLLRWVADAGNLTTGTIPDARISTTLPADKAFRRGNILAPVGFSGSVPNGGLLDWGSNPNGQYLRLADGTQDCLLSVTFTGSGVGQRTAVANFPAAFANTNYKAVGSMDSFASLSYGFGIHQSRAANAGTGAAGFAIQVTGAGAGDLIYSVLVSGRWI